MLLWKPGRKGPKKKEIERERERSEIYLRKVLFERSQQRKWGVMKVSSFVFGVSLVIAVLALSVVLHNQSFFSLLWPWFVLHCSVVLILSPAQLETEPVWARWERHEGMMTGGIPLDVHSRTHTPVCLTALWTQSTQWSEQTQCVCECLCRSVCVCVSSYIYGFWS